MLSYGLLGFLTFCLYSKNTQKFSVFELNFFKLFIYLDERNRKKKKFTFTLIINFGNIQDKIP